MRIRSRLLLLAWAVLVPALIGAGIGLAYIYRGVQDFHRQSMQETTRALALALDRDMGRREAILRTLGGSTSLGRGELERFHLHASGIAKATDSAIILSDLEGRQLVNTRLPYGAKLPSMLPEERAMRAKFGDEATLFSGVYLPPAGLGPHSFAIQVPLQRDGRVTHFLTMGAFARQVQELLQQQRLPEGWHATIIDRQGTIAARGLEPEKFVGQRVRDSLLQAVTSRAEGYQDGVSLSGVSGTVFFSRAPQSGWTYLVTVPHSAIYGPAYRATALMAGVSLLLFAIGVLAAVLVARRISRPVEALREAAERLGRNEPVEARPTGTVELDAVARAMAGASARLRGATAELEQRVAQAVAGFEQSQRALVQAQKLEALGRLTGGIAHDFNNVLQTLTAGIQVVQRGAAPAAQQEVLAGCQRAVARGSELARQLMAFGRVQEVRVETIDTAARLAEARHLLGGALPANTSLEYDVPQEVWPVTVDPAQLELALLNLVINARDAMAEGGTIVIRARNETVAPGNELPAGAYVELAVVDTGHGMSEEVAARALDPFYTTKDVGKGSGMGLPQAYGFARQNGGTLALESRPGKGTTVRLWLPRAAGPLSLRATAHPPAAPRASKGRVLLVEDDEHVRATVSTALRAAGFEIDVAVSADEALRRIDAAAGYDAVLTDVVMPGTMGGLELAARIRERHPGTGVVVVTGYSSRAVDIPGVRALAKPYDVQQAVDALNAVMDPNDA